MSKSSHLPPRHPFQRKASIHPTYEPISISPLKVDKLDNRFHNRFSDQDQPDWLDDLLSDSDSGFKPISLLQSASDHSVETDSPREKCNIQFSESSVLLALSKYASQGHMQFSDETCQNSGISNLGVKVDCYGSEYELSGESNTGKRHPGQRSRARKLQYIGELEGTINSLKALESEMVTKCSTLIQKRVAMLMENCRLKQQMARLQQQKLMVDDEYQMLRKEADKLKLGLGNSWRTKLHRYAAYAGSDDTGNTEMYCHKLNWN